MSNIPMQIQMERHYNSPKNANFWIVRYLIFFYTRLKMSTTTFWIMAIRMHCTDVEKNYIDSVVAVEEKG